MQVEYVDYDKITDDMMYLGNNINLRFNVLLSKKNSSIDNSRRFFHSEYRYESKYDDTQVAVTIKRCFSYYMSIDVGGDNWDRSVMIRIQDIIILYAVINNKEYVCKCGNDTVVREERNGNENEDEGTFWKLELL